MNTDASSSTYEGGEDDIATAKERADVKRRLETIKNDRDFDANARKQYAHDRRRARGDHGQFAINTQRAGSYIDVLKSILYARNPDLDVQPSDATQPPPMGDIVDMAREKLSSDPKVKAMMEEVGTKETLEAEHNKQLAMKGATVAVLDPQARQKLEMAAADPSNDPVEIGERAAQAWLDMTIKDHVREMMKPYRERVSHAKMFGRTAQIVVSDMWRKANLKRRGKRQTGSTLTIGLGWVKANWQERKGHDKETARQIYDAQQALARVEAMQARLADSTSGTGDVDAKRAEIENTLKALQAHEQILLARGFVCDFINGEDVQVSSAVECLEDYVDAPYLATRVFKLVSEAEAEFEKLRGEKIKKATRYKRRKPLDRSQSRHVGAAATDVTAEEADAYVTGGGGASSSSSTESETVSGEEYVCVWEMQDRMDGTVYTLVEGCEYYAREPFAPQYKTTRFYDLFQLAFVWVDGERHPVSLVSRAATLLDDDNQLASNRKEHRKRSIPKTAFDATSIEKDDAERVAKAAIGEMVPVTPKKPGANVANMFAPIKYPAIDQALYDPRPGMEVLETIFGAQEALMSTVDKQKTATEAEIQQTGTNARTFFKRDAHDEMFDDLAMYSTEIALQALSADDVREIAGPWAFWPEGLEIEDLEQLVTIKIKAGSSGRPNTTAQQQSWSVNMPQLKQLIMDVGRLRNSSPEEIADCLEELANETFARTGEHLDPSRFLPKPPSNKPGNMPTPPPGTPQPAPMGAGAPAPNGQAAPMPSQQKQPPAPEQLPVPHNGHVPPGATQQ